MKPPRVAICFLLAVVVLAIAGGIVRSGQTRPATASKTAPSTGTGAVTQRPAGREPAERQAALTASLTALAAAEAAPDFAVAVLDHRTGTSYSFGAGEAFETASVVKVDILAALLLQARADDRSLTADEQRLARVMIQQSDNDAATALWGKIGDASGLSDANKVLGLTETVPGADGWWGWTKTTVSDQVKLLEVIADPAGPLGDSGQLILDLMGGVADDQDWGVSAAAATGESTALKNGWMTRANQDGRWTVNSAGRITGAGTDVTLVVMTRGDTTLSAGTAFVEKLAKLTRTQLGW